MSEGISSRSAPDETHNGVGSTSRKLKDLRLLACHLNDNSSERPRRIRGSRSSWGARSEADRMLDEGGFPRTNCCSVVELDQTQDPREADGRCTGDQSSHNRSQPFG